MLTLGAATFNYLNRYSLEEALDHLASCGFRYIEMMSTPPHMFPRHLAPAQRRGIRRALEGRQLTLTSMQPTYFDLNLISVNPAIRQESIRQVQENLRLAGELGARLLVLVTGKRHPLLPLPMERAWPLVLEAIRECNQVAKDAGVMIGIENVRNQFMDSGADVARLVLDLNDDNIQGVIDVANANVVESPIQALEAVRDNLALVHLSDNDGRTWTHSPVGQGNIDFSLVAQKLQDIGYNGPCILEVTHDPDPLRAMEESRDRLLEMGWQTQG